MTASVSRKLCQRFLYLYPEPFRCEFGEDILAIFEASKETERPSDLLFDIFLSAVRQQFRYQAMPVPKNVPLYSEVSVHPGLASTLAGVVFAYATVVMILAPPAKIRSFELSAHRNVHLRMSGPIKAAVHTRTLRR